MSRSKEDDAEYHVNRMVYDQESIVDLCGSADSLANSSVILVRRAGPSKVLGSSLGIENTFSIVAGGRLRDVAVSLEPLSD